MIRVFLVVIVHLVSDCTHLTQCPKLMVRITLPDHVPNGQATHVLRHTFASHFMMNKGDILVLQRILGHTKIEQTMAYSHFAPEHLIQAVHLNPLEN